MFVYKSVQTTGDNFRVQVLKYGEKYVLWVAESEEEVYTVVFDKAVSVDLFKINQQEDKHKIIMLYEQDEEMSTIEIGLFTEEEATKFVTWLVASLQNVT